MADNTNPSVVNDDSGSNYGGINTASGLGDAQMAYLNNLATLAKEAGPKTQSPEQYYPQLGQNVEVGSMSTKTLGTTPIFAAGPGVIPWGMYDSMQQARQEAQENYLKAVKMQLDKPLFDQKLKLADPWKQPAFAAKVQNTIDSYLDLYSKRFGGDMMKAYIATKNDKNFQRTMDSYGQYADMFKQVFDQALQVEQDKQDPNKYVSPDTIKTVDDFLYKHDNLELQSPDQLMANAKQFKSQMGAIKLAQIVSDGVQDSKISSIDPSTMSTDEVNAYIKTVTTNKGVADDLIAKTEEANKGKFDFFNDPTQKDLFEREVRNRVKFSTEQQIEQIHKDIAGRDMTLQKYGITDDKGNIQFGQHPTPLIGTVGYNAVNYPIEKGQTIPTVANAQCYVRDQTGKLVRVTLPNSYKMQPTSEYDVMDPKASVVRGRYIEGTVTFGDTEEYTPSGERTVNKNGTITQTSTGDGKSSVQVSPVNAVDDNGNVVPLLGTITVAFPYQTMKGQIEGSIPYMNYVHKQLEKNYEPFYGQTRENLDNTPNAIKPGSRVVPVPPNAKMSFFQDDPNVIYNYQGVNISGAELWKKHRAELATKK
jgi:hypothetical protein